MTDLYAALLGWAIHLSGFPPPAIEPVVVPVPHAYFVEHACGGRECKVWGWYAGGRRLYIDERMDPQASTLAASVVVHEMVHYLQAVERGDDELAPGAAFGRVPTCQQALAWELQAYAVQREFIHQHGVYLPVGLSMLRAHCEVEP
jgi:hypothetical protein